MVSTIYILISAADYWLDALPSHRHIIDASAYERENPRIAWGPLSALERFLFPLATANQVFCIVLLLLKLAGILSWW